MEKLILVKENDVYKREARSRFSAFEIITFKKPNTIVYNKEDYDWYMTVALEKSDFVTENRDELTSELIINYRNAIREAYQKQIDKSLNSLYTHPKNRNTISGILSYINRINSQL